MKRVKGHSVHYELPPSQELKRVSTEGCENEQEAIDAVRRYHEGLTVVIKGVEYLTDLKPLPRVKQCA
jgi:hypothetical protein